MGVLVVAEHDNEVLQESTLNTVTAALEIDSDVSVLVAGKNCSGIVDAVAKVAGASKVLTCEHELYEHQLAESLAGLIASIAPVKVRLFCLGQQGCSMWHRFRILPIYNLQIRSCGPSTLVTRLQPYNPKMRSRS